jgi:hypothetical protein
MTTETHIRNQITRQVQRIPPYKLNELIKYLDKLEREVNKKKKVLSYAGVWEKMDEDIFKEFTDDLIARREKTHRRHHE